MSCVIHVVPWFNHVMSCPSSHAYFNDVMCYIISYPVMSMTWTCYLLGATVPFDASGVTPVSWSHVEGSSFDVRVGPAYKK